jgi:predicted transcriptional regulator
MGDREHSGSDLREAVRKRSDVLATLRDEPAQKPALVDRLDVSRSTVDRAIEALRDRDLVRRDGDGYRVTTHGRLAHDSYRAYVERTDSLAAAAPLLAAVPAGARVDPALFERGDISVAEPHAPENAIAPAIEYLRSAERSLIFSPVVKSSYVSLVHEAVTDRGLELELVLGAGASESLASLAAVTDTVDGLAAAESASLYRTDRRLPFTLFLMLDGGADTVGVTVHDDGAIVGTVISQAPDALAWGRAQFEQFRDGAEPLSTEALR